MPKRLKQGSTELLDTLEKMMLTMAKDPSQATPIKLSLIDKGMKLVLVKEKVTTGYGGMFEEEEGATDPDALLGPPLMRNALEDDDLFEEEEADGPEDTDSPHKATGAKVG